MIAMRDPREDQAEAAVADARREAKKMTRQSNGRGIFVGRPDAAPESVRPMLFEVGRALDAHELGVCEHVEESPRVGFLPQWEPNRALCEECWTSALALWFADLKRTVRSGEWMACNCCGRSMFQVHSIYAPIGPWVFVALVCQECAGVQ